MTRAVLFFASFLIVLVGATVLASALRARADSVLTTVPVGTTPKENHLTPDGSNLFVSNEASNSVSVIATSTDTVIGGAIPVGTNPGPIRFTPNGAKAYVVNQLSNNVSAIDVATRAEIIKIPVGTSPVTLAVTLDGSKVYVVNKGSNNVYVISTATNTIIGSPITVGTAPNTTLKTPDGSKLYVANSTSNDVSVISTASDSVVATISVLPSKDPGSIHFLPNGTKAYVANRGCSTCNPQVAPTVSVINVASHSVVKTINAGAVDAAPHAMRITPDGSKLYVVNKHGNEVMVIDTATDTILRSIQLQQGSCTNIALGVGSCPVRIELTPDGSSAYVVEERPLAANGVLTIICTGVVPSVCGGADTDTVVGTVVLGNSPVDIEILKGIKAYIDNSVSNNVSVVALASKPASGNLSGVYAIQVTAQQADIVPGSYYTCKAYVLQGTQISGTAGPNDLKAKALCYTDNPGVVVNPDAAGASTCPAAPANMCGDGWPGAPPPGCTDSPAGSCANTQPHESAPTDPGLGHCPATNKGPTLFYVVTITCHPERWLFAHVNSAATKHAMLTGSFDKTNNTMNLLGCFVDQNANTSLGNVYVQTTINVHTGHGLISYYIQQTSGNCTGGTPAGGPLTYPIDIVRQATDSPSLYDIAHWDSDGDGCNDAHELTDTPALTGNDFAGGGMRDPLNRWDFFDPYKGDNAHKHNALDMLIVQQHFGANEWIKDPANQANPPVPNDGIVNPSIKAYSPGYDRTVITGSNNWNLGPGDGYINAHDMLAVQKSFGHTCLQNVPNVN